MQLIQRKHETGASLVVGLVLLLVATLVVFAGVRGTQMQERMTSNLNNKAISLKAAEAGASDFLAWIQEELDNGDWPGQADYEASNLPKDAQSSVAVISNVLSGQYWFEDVVWDPAFVTFVAIGDADGLAESRVRVRVNAPGGEPPGGLAPPAALSCFGARCTISPGQGQAVIDGHDYDLPDENCSGRGGPTGCYDKVPRSDPPYRVPGVYFQDDASSAPPGTGSTKDCKYTGLSRTDMISNNDTSDWSKVGASDGCNDSTFYASQELYPVEEGQLPGGNEPQLETFFGPGTIGALTSGDTDAAGNPAFGTRTKDPDNLETYPGPLVTYIDESIKVSESENFAGILIVDGERFFKEGVFDKVLYEDEPLEFEMTGNAMFEGIIVVKNCAKVNMKGTAFVYGAIIIDSTGCPTDYDPFAGNGTPNIRYSFEGLGSAGRAFGGGTELRVVSWIDSLPD